MSHLIFPIENLSGSTRFRIFKISSLKMVLGLVSIFLIFINAETAYATSVNSCQIITSPGYYALTQDILNNNAAKCIEITSSDVILDGNGHTIDGLDSWNTYGVYVYNSSTTLTNVTVKNLTVTDWYYGIYYRNAQNGLIENNTANSNSRGIYIHNSSTNTVANNTIVSSASSAIGINVYYHSHNNTISGNDITLSNGKEGIRLSTYVNNTKIMKNTINISGGSIWNPVYGISLDEWATGGGIFYTTISGNTIFYDGYYGYGIYMIEYTYENNVRFNTISGNNITITSYRSGIYAKNTDDNIIRNNIIHQSWSGSGIFTADVVNMTILNNTVVGGDDTTMGIRLGNTDYSIIENNTVSAGQRCLWIESSDSNIITGNNCSGNVFSASIEISSSTNNTLRRNIMTNNTPQNLWVHGNKISYYIHDIDTSNLADGLPVYYIVNQDNIVLDSVSTRHITVVGSSNVTIRNNHLSDTLNLVYDGEVKVINNTISDSYHGIYLYYTNNSTIEFNTLFNNEKRGIYLEYSDNILIKGNNASHNRARGIQLSNTENATLVDNIVSYNSYEGILLNTHSGITKVVNNTILYNGGSGIDINLWLYGSATVTDNIASHNSMYGIYLNGLTNSSIVNNVLINNSEGIELDEVINTIIANNIIVNNYYGIYFYYHSNNLIYNNIFNNTNNFYFSDAAYPNTWNITKTIGTNIMNGPYLGGNYWAKPDGTGFSQICNDTDADGICDSPYYLATNNIDYLPLTTPLISDTTPPHVTIISPQNTTYYTINIQINVSASDSSGISTVIAQVDGTTNITLTLSNGYYVGNINISYGNHWIRIYANDTRGNMNSTQVVYFRVNAIPPVVHILPFMIPCKYFRSDQVGLRQRVPVEETATFGIWLKNMDDVNNTVRISYSLDPETPGDVEVEVPSSITLLPMEEKTVEVKITPHEEGSFIIHFTAESPEMQQVSYDFVFVVDAFES